jgi:AcrR family transcriptional regulator
MARARSEEKRRAILVAALRRFLHYGLKKTSMQEVAADAGLAVGTLYLYFADKDALVMGCAERFAEEREEEVQALLSRSLRADRKLVTYVRARYQNWQEVGLRAPGALELAEAILRLEPEKTVQGAQDFTRHLAAILGDGVKSGVFAGVKPERDARVLALSLAVFFPVAGREHPAQPGESELELVLGWFLKRLRSKE